MYIQPINKAIQPFERNWEWSAIIVMAVLGVSMLSFIVWHLMTVQTTFPAFVKEMVSVSAPLPSDYQLDQHDRHP